MTTKFGDIPLPANAEAHLQTGDFILIQRGNTVFRVPAAAGGQALPSAAAVVYSADAPAVVARKRGEWEEVTHNTANATVGYINKHLALHVGDVNVAADALLTAAHKGALTTKLWSVSAAGAFTANTAAVEQTPVWLVKGAGDLRLVAGTAAPAPGSGRWRLQIGFVEDNSDKANNNYVVAFDFGAAMNWAVV